MVYFVNIHSYIFFTSEINLGTLSFNNIVSKLSNLKRLNTLCLDLRHNKIKDKMNKFELPNNIEDLSLNFS